MDGHRRVILLPLYRSDTIRAMHNANPQAAKLVFLDRKFEVRAGLTVRRAVEQCGFPPEAMLAIKDGELITDDIVLRGGDEIKLIAVISGGSRLLRR
jgi:sulfur carrier protein ThiS